MAGKKPKLAYPRHLQKPLKKIMSLQIVGDSQKSKTPLGTFNATESETSRFRQK